MSGAYYNEIDPFAAQWLRNLIRAGHLPEGEVDERSIRDVHEFDLIGFVQCHFFAGIGGWPYAARLAGWPDDRPLWTGSCPCQPFSVAGKGRGADDPRHLWPDFFYLIRAARPVVVMGEQVAGAAGYGWLDGVVSDLAGEGYAARGVDIPACAVDAPHIRSRLYWVAQDMAHAHGADAERGARHWTGPGNEAGPGPYGQLDGRGHAVPRHAGGCGDVVHADDPRLEGLAGHVDGKAGRPVEGRHVTATSGGDMADAADGGRREEYPHAGGRGAGDRPQGRPSGHGAGGGRNGTFWSDHVWLVGADGKARRAQPGLPLLAHGIPGRVGRLRAYGNAIVPQLAAEVIAAFMECAP